MTPAKRGRKRKRNKGWFRKGFDARRSSYRFTAQDCRVGWLVANCKHPHLRDWLKKKVCVYYWKKGKGDGEKATDGRAEGNLAGGRDDGVPF